MEGVGQVESDAGPRRGQTVSPDEQTDTHVRPEIAKRHLERARPSVAGVGEDAEGERREAKDLIRDEEALLGSEKKRTIARELKDRITAQAVLRAQSQLDFRIEIAPVEQSRQREKRSAGGHFVHIVQTEDR